MIKGSKKKVPLGWQSLQSLYKNIPYFLGDLYGYNTLVIRQGTLTTREK